MSMRALIGMVEVFDTPAGMTEADLRPADELRQACFFVRAGGLAPRY